MRSKISKKIGTGVMALLITVCFIPAVAGAFTPGEGRQEKGFGGKGIHPPALGIWRNPQMVQQLEITEQQVKELRDADFTSREKCLALRAQLDSHRLKMEKAFSEDTVDPAAVRATAEGIADLKGKLYMQRIESRLALGKILNADQIKELRVYVMEHKRPRPGPGDKRIPRRHGMERPFEK
jgi:Spy/CpxP family protein refolding chaperone